MSRAGTTPADEPQWPSTGWVAFAAGRRVTLRVTAGVPGPTGGPGYRELVGLLQRATPDAWHIRKRDGTHRVIDPATVVAARVVPEPARRLSTASEIDIGHLEQIAADGWQPLEQERLGAWVLRASHGFTGRANSVLPIGDPTVPLDQALDTVREWYASRSLTAMIQLPLPLLTELGEQLSLRGWDEHHLTHVMVCDLPALRMSSPTDPAPGRDLAVRTMSTPDDEWLSAFRYRGQPLPTEVGPILTHTDHPVFVSVRHDDGAVCAVGRGAITGRWLGITAVEVDEPHRRQGLGRRVMATLADYASMHRVRHVYLQVAHDNAPALALYDRLGFVRHHDYVYRRWVAE